MDEGLTTYRSMVDPKIAIVDSHTTMDEDFHIDGVPLQLTLPVYLRYSSSLEETSRITKSDTMGCLFLLLTIAILMKMMVVMLRNNSLQKAYSKNQ